MHCGSWKVAECSLREHASDEEAPRLSELAERCGMVLIRRRPKVVFGSA